MTYFFETYGCQMNVAESASIEQLFIARGWKKADDAQVADIAVINTCSVRATAENRVFGRLGWYAGLKAVRAKENGAKSKTLEKAVAHVQDGAKPLTLVVTGCMAERLLKSLKDDYPCIDYVVGTFAKKYFGEIITAVEKAQKWKHSTMPLHMYLRLFPQSQARFQHSSLLCMVATTSAHSALYRMCAAEKFHVPQMKCLQNSMRFHHTA